MCAVRVLADDRDPPVAMVEAGIDDHPIALGEAIARDDDSSAVRAEDARLRNGREAFPHPHVEVVQRRRAQFDEDLSCAWHRIWCVLVAEHLGAAVLVDSNGLHAGTISHMTAAELAVLARELGLDVVGSAPAAAYDDTERHIRERRERGLFADMRFTMSRPDESCHPETLLDGARSVISAAHCYYVPEPLEPGEGRLARYTWYDGYAELRDRLAQLGHRLGGDYRVLVDANQHVDREAAARSGSASTGRTPC